MSKKDKFPVQARQAFNLLSSPIAKAMLPNKTYRDLVADFLVNHPAESFERDFKKLFNSVRFKELFASTHTELKEFDHGLSISGIPAERALRLCMLVLEEHHVNLRNFAPKRLDIERFILLGDCENALEELEKVKESYGGSLWYIRTKMLILSELRLTKELIEFCDSLDIRKDRSLMDYMIHNSRVLIDTDNPLTVLKNLIFSASNELKQAQLDELASLFELLFAPWPLNEGINFWPAIERIHAFSAIDQYIFLEKIAMCAVAEKGINLTRFPINALEELISFLAGIMGIEISKYPLETQRAAKVTLRGKRILELYECGKYEETISEFYENIADLENPLAYVNLVAKSTAMLKRPSLAETQRIGLIPSLISQLVTIYGLESNAANAEEMLKSLAARYNSTRWCIHVQAAIFKALPWRYEGKNRRIAAKLAVLSDVEVTPLLSQIVYKFLRFYPRIQKYEARVSAVNSMRCLFR
jgi:hypothetical protein